ncbi:MAG: radical SAM/SPASM domain-containing protein [Thermodesulfobacteriota bacterium]
MCTCRCGMCSQKDWKRTPYIMRLEEFAIILKKFVQHKDRINFVTLQGWGEPLLDPTIAEKVRVAKRLGFQGVGIPTNCTELTEEMTAALLHAGLDTIICSVDGYTRAVHESIRVGSDFDEVVSNVLRFIEMRNQGGSTKIIIRFIRQKANHHEWRRYASFWRRHIREAFGDMLIRYDVHNWGGSLAGYEERAVVPRTKPSPAVCKDLFSRIIIFSDGRVGLCCADYNGFFEFGDAIAQDPVALYNNELFESYRKTMLQGRIANLEHCKTCTLPLSQATRLLPGRKTERFLSK